MSAQTAPAEHAILGLLDLDDGPGHGYDLARHFADGQPLANVLRLEPGMLYHHLKKLERHGWVESSLEQQATRPARQVYQLTDEGRAELRRWLSEPVLHTREIRIEFLIKLYFARRSDPALAASLIAGQLNACRQWEAALIERLDELEGSTAPAPDREFARIVLELRIEQTRAAVAWLRAITSA
jgi:DNA-binding PadR family transcriptional regulator